MLRLDMGGGRSRQDGWLTLDSNKDADITHDLDTFPYPLESDSVDKMRCFHTLEHLREPLNVMEELFRIAKDGCVLHIAVPYWKLDHPIRNPTHRHAFHPDWFRNLDATKPCWKGGMRHLCKMDWKLAKEKFTHIWYFPLKSCEYEVWLRANKKRE